MAQRLGTFNEWPQSTGQLPQSLAEAGLFFTGINDLCRCFTCDGGLQRWDRDDDPWLEHTRWFPHCSYVREMKGQEYIDMVQVAAQRAQLEEEESVVVRGLTNLDFQNTDPSQRTLRFTADELVQILAGRQERGEPIPDDDTDPEEQDPMEENKRLKGILKCIMCKENDCNILLLPCTHHRLCEPCAESVTNCPACGRRVEERVKTYMA
ncbi:BIR7B-like protein [Mya arenaria]|uniref:BIR7B-like protein n=1 Tax=Mya arenaria TaxID=6604 RepID=A0ABY7EH23_MYAAR|nr:BIR7B-like protein [Mya arenaria]